MTRLVVAAIAGVWASGLLPQAGCAAESPTLRSVAERRDLHVGAMILDPDWQTPRQQRLVAAHFNAATIGTYWTRTHPTRDRWDWSLTDAAVEWAARHDLAVHLHPVLYPADDHLPAWVKESPASAAAAILADHVDAAVGRYRERCTVWDVVNEPVDPDGRDLRDCWWLRSLGTDYIPRAFRLARAADPEAQLVLNEYGCELSTPRQTRRWRVVRRLVRDLHADGLIDGFGWQLHVTADEVLGEQFVLAERMAELAALGVDNYVTELDVAIPDGTPRSLARQAEAYRRIAEAWLAAHGDGWLQTWGVSDRHTWLDPPGTPPANRRRPLLFDAQWQPKPAYRAVLTTLDRGE